MLRKAPPIAEELLARLRALTPPSGDKRTVARYLDALSQQKEIVRQLAGALQQEDTSRAKALFTDFRQSEQQAEDLAQDYGFTKCSSGD